MAVNKNNNLRRVESISSRFFIGVDLGTTNSSVAYIDRLSESGPTCIKTFMIPQVSSQGIVENFDLLPSFFYFPAGFELASGAIKLPWKEDIDYTVGKFAREYGAVVPGRMISSVKSWLCNLRVDRQKKILPWNKDNSMTGFSPLEVSSYYIEHIKNAWNHTMANGDPDYYFENQEIILTVPASFDESARELTLKAAHMAGVKNVTLLEEPQAAFYYWIYKNRVDWAEKLNDGDVILICDVGGGTTDFTLIHASKNSENFLELKRVAVGDHILLGGDNMDMAIAHYIEKTRLGGGKKLDALSWTSLCMKCRQLKESLLGDRARDEESISIAGRGRSIVGSTMKFSLKRDELAKIIVEGFISDVDFDNIDKKISSFAGLRESGLLYAEDPSISNQLARFLKRHVGDIARDLGRGFVRPDKILFNGGVFKSETIRNRVSELVAGWLGAGKGESGFTSLDNPNYDLAVSLGAAYYAFAKSGSGIRIKSGSARSYFIGVSEAGGENLSAARPLRDEKALCIVSRGMEEGKKTSIDAGFQVITNQPVRFALYSSTVKEGEIGEIINVNDDDFIMLPPLFTCLTYGKKSRTPQIDISLSAYLSEIGTIDLYCLSKTSEHRWKLQFNFRKHESLKALTEAPETDAAAAGPMPSETESRITPETLKAAEELIEKVFLNRSADSDYGLLKSFKNLESLVGAKKEQWPTEFIRGLFNVMIKLAESKSFSPAHEERWYNMAGFFLRPGFGVPMDEWRVKESLRVTFGGLKFKSNKNSAINFYVFYRRISGGMTAGQQLEVFNRLKDQLYGGKKSSDKPFKVSPNNQEHVEMLRMVAGFELLPEQDRVYLGNLLKKTIHRDGPNPISVWALSRLGARKLVYGGPECVVTAAAVEKWIETLLEFDWAKESYIPHAAIMMARVTGDRKLDLSSEIMSKIQKRIETCPASEHLYDLLMNMAVMTEDDQRLFFGESLPHGIVIKS